MKVSIIIKLIIGFLALILGAIGLLLPVWPTTPFVLLALGCFSATPRIQRKILRIRFFKAYYESYTKGSGLPRQTVIASLSFLWGMLLLSSVLVQGATVISILSLVGIAVTIHILWIARTKGTVQSAYTKEEKENE